LAALARTCKTFHDPAMNLLWAELDDLDPLLGCVTVTNLFPTLIYVRCHGVPKVSLDLSHKLSAQALMST
ncbi:hypothetical protein M405DRAFT_746684, partial [Rhizopogon salebrosus TDB-379]